MPWQLRVLSRIICTLTSREAMSDITEPLVFLVSEHGSLPSRCSYSPSIGVGGARAGLGLGLIPVRRP